MQQGNSMNSLLQIRLEFKI